MVFLMFSVSFLCAQVVILEAEQRRPKLVQEIEAKRRINAIQLPNT
jgi:hypothetical protein